MLNEPAFPCSKSEKTLRPSEFTNGMIEDIQEVHYAGMTLRDYFAAKFIDFLAPTSPSDDFPDPDFVNKSGKTVAEDCASRAYKFADAMLTEREKNHAQE